MSQTLVGPLDHLTLPPSAPAVDLPPLPTGLDVELVRWPEDSARRRELHERGMPRLLLLAPDCPPPLAWHHLEDWVREPVTAADLAARAATLAGRARLDGATAPRGPYLDPEGVLWLGSAWVGIPPAQQPVVRLLLERRGEVVRADEVRATYAAGDASGHPSAVRTVMARLARRLADVGLALHTVRGRGYLLEVAAPPR